MVELEVPDGREGQRFDGGSRCSKTGVAGHKAAAAVRCRVVQRESSPSPQTVSWLPIVGTPDPILPQYPPALRLGDVHVVQGGCDLQLAAGLGRRSGADVAADPGALQPQMRAALSTRRLISSFGNFRSVRPKAMFSKTERCG